MNSRFAAGILAVVILFSFRVVAQTTNATEPDVPKGEVLKFSFADAKIFPGTYRDYLATHLPTIPRTF